MRRREFIAALAGLTAWPLVGRAQPARTIPKVGVLVWGSPGHDPYVEPFRQGLRELGYTEGRDVRLDLRYAEGDLERGRAAVRDLLREDVALIVASTTPAAHIAKAATTTIPIVMAPVSDPLATGLVTNLARPGGNLTGVSGVTTEVISKGVEALGEIVPDLRRIGFLGSTRDPNAATFLRAIEATASALRIEVLPVLVATLDEFEGAIAEMLRGGAQAVIVQPIFANESAELAALANRNRLATASSIIAAKGGLMIGYGAAPAKLMRQAASQVDKILKGANPGDLPVEQSTHFELAVNLQTARTLGLTIPPSLLVRADEVIE
jgi:putative ABC transport system substrate-binding protein